MSRAALVVLLLPSWIGGGLMGCAVASKLVYTPDELRAEVASRAPTIPLHEIVVPFELNATHVEQTRRLVRYAKSDTDQVRILTEAFSDRAGFGLHYSPNVTASAEETLRTSQGNCLSLASVFVGLARAAGLIAYYVDASSRIHETRYDDDGLIADIGHITVVVRTADEAVSLDFSRLGRVRWYRIISDLEALAHFYNNRGFDLIDRAKELGVAVDWLEVSHSFSLAVQILPEFAQARNNLGISEVHLGHIQQAIANYQTAIRHDPNLAAPRFNLGSLYLQSGDVSAALESLNSAAKLEPRGPHIQYSLAVARLRLGDRDGAIKALHQAIDLRRGYAEARTLLNQLTHSAEAKQ